MEVRDLGAKTGSEAEDLVDFSGQIALENVKTMALIAVMHGESVEASTKPKPKPSPATCARGPGRRLATETEAEPRPQASRFGEPRR